MFVLMYVPDHLKRPQSAHHKVILILFVFFRVKHKAWIHLVPFDNIGARNLSGVLPFVVANYYIAFEYFIAVLVLQSGGLLIVSAFGKSLAAHPRRAIALLMLFAPTLTLDFSVRYAVEKPPEMPVLASSWSPELEPHALLLHILNGCRSLG
jgi:hypothetical protein